MLYVPSWLTKENVTFVIAVAGFILSILNFVKNVMETRKKLKVKVKHTFKECEKVLILIEFVNCSRLGISVTSGSFEDSISVGTRSTTVFTYADPAKSEKVSERTQRFPIKVEPLSAVTVFMETDKWNPEFPRECNAKFGTTRGYVRTKISLPTDHATLKALLPHLK